MLYFEVRTFTTVPPNHTCAGISATFWPIVAWHSKTDSESPPPHTHGLVNTIPIDSHRLDTVKVPKGDSQVATSNFRKVVSLVEALG